MTNIEDPRPHRLARSITLIMLGLTLVAFTGTVVLQWLGCGNLFDSSRPEPALAYGLAMVPLNGLAGAAGGALTAELVRVVQEALQPEHVSVWLRRQSDVDRG